MVDEEPLDVSSMKFVSFNKFFRLPMQKNEKETVSFLRKLEARKGRRVVALSVKGKPSSTSHFDR